MVSLDTDLVGAPWLFSGYLPLLGRGAGKPKESQRRLYVLAHQSLNHNSLFRAGVSFREIAELAFQAPEPTATPAAAHAHGIAWSTSIRCCSPSAIGTRMAMTTLLEEGMVLCVRELFSPDKAAGRALKLEQQILMGQSDRRSFLPSDGGVLL